ncbi:MAG: squalene--hopene cyclase [Planctomycetaceae bacterium]|nr:squalene--hopene cyclase [Planctomycetaceae bacterium]
MIDRIRLLEANRQLRRELLAERSGDHWVGRLASSALATATAISALSIVQRQRRWEQESADPTDGPLSESIMRGLRWLSQQQNSDGGWGDTNLSHSNIATSMLAHAAFRLTGVPAETNGLLDRAEHYMEAQGGIKGLKKRYGRDKTFAVPILTNCALAGTVPWSKVSPLPFELAALPQSMYRFLRMPVVSYAIPALVAIGQVRFHHRPPWNPISRITRNLALQPSLEVLERMQPESGGYLEAIPLTSFVVMSLAAMGKVRHPVVEKGVEFLLASAREDGSWPIDSNLATWNTSLALNALGTQDFAKNDLDPCVDWLLSCQHLSPHPFTGAAPGGWGWSDLSGAVPDSDDTPGALLALRQIVDLDTTSDEHKQKIVSAARAGIQWLLDLQNRDGGWPTFCRGWGKLPFDRSGSDLTAHALRALQAWHHLIEPSEWAQASQRGLRFLGRQQRSDGTWLPLWFGNQNRNQEENPIYGTAKVLMGLIDLGKSDHLLAQKGRIGLLNLQNFDGGWGGGQRDLESGESQQWSSIEETALAIEALLPEMHRDERVKKSVETGVAWLLEEVSANRHRQPSPIGFYFAKLWYYEDLYPLIFTVSTLGSAMRQMIPPADRKLTPAQLTH